jgi:hypothetical protein
MISDQTDAQGAFVEVDINRLDKDLLIMLGMKQALEKYVNGFRAQAASLEHAGTAHVLREVADIMAADLDKITVEFSARAIRGKAATLHDLKGGRN